MLVPMVHVSVYVLEGQGSRVEVWINWILPYRLHPHPGTSAGDPIEILIEQIKLKGRHKRRL